MLFLVFLVAAQTEPGFAVTPGEGSPPVVWSANAHGLSRWSVELSTPPGRCARADVDLEPGGGHASVLSACGAGESGAVELTPLSLGDDVAIVLRARGGASSSLVVLAPLCGSLVRLDLGTDVVRPSQGAYGPAPYDRVVSATAHTIRVVGAQPSTWRVDGCGFRQEE